MHLGIFAKTFPGNKPCEVLAAARQAGYAAVQYNMACSGLGALPERVTPADAEAVRRAAQQTGVEIAAVSATYNMIDPIAERREAGRRSFSAIAAAAKDIGASLLTVCTGSRDPNDQWRDHPDNATPASWEEMCREFELLLEVAERESIMLGVEPELSNVVSSAAKAKRLIESFGSKRIGIVIDAANLFETAAVEEQRNIISEAIGLLGPSIVMAHAKDRAAKGGFAAAGRGVIDWGFYISELKANGFDGALVTHSLEASDARSVAEFLDGQISALTA